MRRQLRCIARAGGGSYVDVQDADKLGGELSALLSRALPLLRAGGDEGQGGLAPEQATLLGEGQYIQTIPSKDVQGPLVRDRRAAGAAGVRLADRGPAAGLERGRGPVPVQALFRPASVPDDWHPSPS